jgi:hypothetical protein
MKGSNKRKQTHEYWLQILKFTLEQTVKVQRGGRITAVLFLQPQREMEMEVNATPRPFYSRPKDLLQSDVYWNVPTWKCAIAHFSVHVSMRPARNVLTAIHVIN